MTYLYNYQTAEGTYASPSYTSTSLRRARKIVACLLLLIMSETYNSSAAITETQYTCPEDNCPLIHTGDDWCVGINCVHVAYYRCGCCGKIFQIYE